MFVIKRNVQTFSFYFGKHCLFLYCFGEIFTRSIIFINYMFFLTVESSFNKNRACRIKFFFLSEDWIILNFYISNIDSETKYRVSQYPFYNFFYESFVICTDKEKRIWLCPQ